MRLPYRASLVSVTIPRYPSIALNSLRSLHTVRISLIVAMLLGWFAFSQRCALGQMLRAQQAAAVQHECCEKGGSHSGQLPVDGRTAECCHALNVLVPDGAKVPDASITQSLLRPLEWIVAALDLPATGNPLAAGTSPPSEARAFTELVLHRSLRSHAPPVRA